jgi:hypothetical protein
METVPVMLISSPLENFAALSGGCRLLAMERPTL